MIRVVSPIASAIGVLVLTACANGNSAGVPTTSSTQSRQSIRLTSLFKDGSFEKPAVPSGSFQLFSNGQKFSKWAIVGANGNVGIVSGTFTQNGFHFPAKSGKQWVDLTGTTQTATGLSQTLATTPNAKYKLVFWIGNVYDPGGIFGVSSTVNVLVNGHQVFAATNSRKSTTQVWRQFSTTITATSSKTKIALINGDPANDTNNGL
ncbi:MAG: DUF642 domain-containing protein, partial [Candidatus Cybelea sp.]